MFHLSLEIMSPCMRSPKPLQYVKKHVSEEFESLEKLLFGWLGQLVVSIPFENFMIYEHVAQVVAFLNMLKGCVDSSMPKSKC